MRRPVKKLNPLEVHSSFEERQADQPLATLTFYYLYLSKYGSFKLAYLSRFPVAQIMPILIIFLVVITYHTQESERPG